MERMFKRRRMAIDFYRWLELQRHTSKTPVGRAAILYRDRPELRELRSVQVGKIVSRLFMKRIIPELRKDVRLAYQVWKREGVYSRSLYLDHRKAQMNQLNTRL